MRTVWKFPLDIGADPQTFTMPTGALSLAVQVQNGEPVLWAVVDTDQPTQERRFQLVGTGHRLDVNWSEYVGTVQLLDGGLVLHLFEIGGPP